MVCREDGRPPVGPVTSQTSTLPISVSSTVRGLCGENVKRAAIQKNLEETLKKVEADRQSIYARKHFAIQFLKFPDPQLILRSLSLGEQQIRKRK